MRLLQVNKSRIAVSLVAAAGGLLALSACGAPEPEVGHARSVGTRRQALLDGIASGDDQNGVVLLGGTGVCSGILVAPNLVLTSRVCVFTFHAAANNAPYECSASGTSGQAVAGAKDPASIEIYLGNHKPFADAVAHGKAVRSAGGFDLCNDNVALLVLDTPITTAKPFQIRLSDVERQAPPPQVGEALNAIGWGIADRSAVQASFRRQHTGAVLSLGGRDYTPPGYPAQYVPAGRFLTDNMACGGDTGGPVLSAATGAVVGVISEYKAKDPTELINDMLYDTCSRSVTSVAGLAGQASWLVPAFREFGAAPWLEGREAPGPMGARCTDSFDCANANCLTLGATSFCTASCDDQACPSGYECAGEPNRRVCVPPLVPAPPGDTTRSGCAIAVRSAPGWGVAGLLALGGILVVRRRRARASSLE